MKANEIDAIVIHCSATPEGKDYHAADVERWHKARGFRTIGYHYVITLDGTIEKGRPETEEGAHCSDSGTSGKAYNKHSIGVCYIGGLDISGKKAKDTRTAAQKESLKRLVTELCKRYPTIKDVLGHRDASPDKNRDGKITKGEWVKSCPSFDVRSEFPMGDKK